MFYWFLAPHGGPRGPPKFSFRFLEASWPSWGPCRGCSFLIFVDFSQLFNVFLVFVLIEFHFVLVLYFVSLFVFSWRLHATKLWLGRPKMSSMDGVVLIRCIDRWMSFFSTFSVAARWFTPLFFKPFFATLLKPLFCIFGSLLGPQLTPKWGQKRQKSVSEGTFSRVFVWIMKFP